MTTQNKPSAVAYFAPPRLPAGAPIFRIADILSILQIEEIARGVDRVIRDELCDGYGTVTLVIERGKIVGVQAMVSQRLLNELLK